MNYSYEEFFVDNKAMNLKRLHEGLPDPCRCTLVTGHIDYGQLCPEISALLPENTFVSSAEVYENGDMNLFVKHEGAVVSRGVIRARHAS